MHGRSALEHAACLSGLLDLSVSLACGGRGHLSPPQDNDKWKSNLSDWMAIACNHTNPHNKYYYEVHGCL